MRSTFPRISLSGTFILMIYMSIQIYVFYKSIYGKALASGEMNSSSSIVLNSIVMSTSLLNVTSHALVVLGALNDTYVLSILVGVGFDVLTRIVQFLWWIHLSFQLSTSLVVFDRKELLWCLGFNTMLVLIYIYHMLIHIRALRIHSAKQMALQLVLTSALNNLRGIPGDYFQDHIFAYTDLGSHLLPMMMCTVLLSKQHSLHVAVGMLGILMIVSWIGLSYIPFHKLYPNLTPQTVFNNDGYIVCQCDACIFRYNRTNQLGSFAFHYKDGICCLWLYSFDTLSTALNSWKDMKIS